METESDVAVRLHGLLMDLARAAGMVAADEALPGRPVSLSQAFALHELAAESPLSQRDLAERLRLEKSTVSRLVVALERRGLLTRERDPGNRRFTRLRLTSGGCGLHASLAAEFQAHYDRWVARMSARERDALLVGLPALVRAVHADGPAAGATTGSPR